MGCGENTHPERAECVTCPNRQRCHGKKPIITQDTLLRLIRETVIEVLEEQELHPRRR